MMAFSLLSKLFQLAFMPLRWVYTFVFGVKPVDLRIDFTQFKHAEIKPFEAHFSDEDLDDLHNRLNNIRFPQNDPLFTENDFEWKYGMNYKYLQDIIAYWRDSYNWRKHEAYINSFPHFTTNIDGLDIHFIHVRSKVPNAVPLILSHGWPGSFVEFLRVIGPLTDPASYGGRESDSFHVVVPSIPGYGFSEAPKQTGFDALEVAITFAKLMHRLGYNNYVAQGGDWGAFISANMARVDPVHCKAVHLNMVPLAKISGFWNSLQFGAWWLTGRRSGLVYSKRVSDSLNRFLDYLFTGSGYIHVQATKPHTLGAGLVDSPVALASWILEKFYYWTDRGDNNEKSLDEARVSRDELITNLMIYWISRSAPSSMRLYYETIHTMLSNKPRAAFASKRVDTPVAYAHFPREIIYVPLGAAKRVFNIKRWTEMPSGGHFAAMEAPDLLVNDIREFVNDLDYRKKYNIPQ